MTRYSRRAIIVVAAPAAAAANSAAKQVDAGGGERTFTVGLSPDGSGPATHYWCSWAMTEVEWAAITARLSLLGADPDGAPAARIFDGEAHGPEEVLAGLGLARLRTG